MASARRLGRRALYLKHATISTRALDKSRWSVHSLQESKAWYQRSFVSCLYRCQSCSVVDVLKQAGRMTSDRNSIFFAVDIISALTPPPPWPHSRRLHTATQRAGTSVPCPSHRIADGRCGLEESQCDLLAFVALQVRMIASDLHGLIFQQFFPHTEHNRPVCVSYESLSSWPLSMPLKS